MSKTLTWADAAADLERLVSNGVNDALTRLLETKHLYQSLHVQQPTSEVFSIAKQLPPEVSERTISRYEELSKARWCVINPADQRPSHFGVEQPRELRFRPPDLKVFCERCDRREAFNLISAEDADPSRVSWKKEVA